MKKLLLVLMSICICGVALASPPNRPNIYTQNTIIDPVAVTGNEVPLYTYLQSGVDTYKAGSITEAAISPTAGIVYGQLNLNGGILPTDISQTIGNIYTFQNIIVPSTGTISGNGTIPIGGIILWSGSVASIPTGWHLCDGTTGTPNLENLFVIGAGGTYAPAASGGSTTISVANLPPIYFTVYGDAGAPSTPYAGFGHQAGTTGTAYNTNTIGSGTAYLQPYYALAYIQRIS